MTGHNDRHASEEASTRRDGQREQNCKCLTEMQPGEIGTIATIGGELRAQLGPMGIRPGKELFVQTVQPFGGPITISVGHNVTSVSRSYARHIHIDVDR